MKHLDFNLFAGITLPLVPSDDFQGAVIEAPASVNLPLLTDEAIERALEQECVG